MITLFRKQLNRRIWKHTGFWILWVTGFTFLQGFGKSYEYYFGWFSYYILTLPIFIAHTYLVAYLLIPHLLNKRLWPAFVLIFLVVFYIFSFVELIFSNEYIFKWFQTGTLPQKNYLDPGNVIISGLGNLYIVLVFLAIRTIRDWNRANNQKKVMEHKKLQRQIEDTISRVQPRMLLHAIDQIEKMVARHDPGVTEAIALTSELLNDIMMHHRQDSPIFTCEVEMVKKLHVLISLFRKDRPELDIFLSGDPCKIQLPSMLLFSFLDMVFREFDHLPALPGINIEASGFSNMISILAFTSPGPGNHEEQEVFQWIIQRMECLFGSHVNITWEKHSYGFSLIMNAVHRDPEAVHLPVMSGE
jgi:two-component system, LytTR family, sensor kinase